MKNKLSEEEINRIKGALFGFFVGDALGVPVEFKSRFYLKENPITKMEEFGTHNQEKGTWSDDTSMVLATMDSIINKGEVDKEDIMNNFVKWYDKGDYTPNGKLFDIGGTTASAIEKYKEDHEINFCGRDDFNSNGNGGLMRILPLPLFFHYQKEIMEEGIFLEQTDEVNSLTHNHYISTVASMFYAYYIHLLLSNKDRYEAYQETSKYMIRLYSLGSDEESLFDLKGTKEVYERLLYNDITKLEEYDIRSTGFVVDTLEAVMYSYLTTTNFKDAILNAVNLGNDTDTIGALTGALAGLEYGYNSIPKDWINDLKRLDYLNQLVNDFIRRIEEVKDI